MKNSLMALALALVLMFIVGSFSLLKASEPRKELIAALIQWESKGDDFAEGDKYRFVVDPVTGKKKKILKPREEWSFGPLQISPKAAKDYNRLCGTNYVAMDCYGNRELSIKIAVKLIDHYATVARLGHEPTDEDKARIHNGGPNGYRFECTEKYWKEVKKFM